ncbi:MAG: hypothetical protein NVV72_01210 [Asticcacaulis sp.]|nr:hypothetical protein [Asticcacaulis sp.]
MSKPSHRAAAGLNKRARQHYPRIKAMPEDPAADTADLAEGDDDLSVANVEGGWSGHKSDLDWPIETDDPWMVGLAIAALFVMGVGILTVIGGLGFGLWHMGAALFHSLD